MCFLYSLHQVQWTVIVQLAVQKCNKAGKTVPKFSERYQKIEENNTNTKQIPKNRRKQHENKTNTKKQKKTTRTQNKYQKIKEEKTNRKNNKNKTEWTQVLAKDKQFLFLIKQLSLLLDVRLVFITGCLQEGSCLSYVIYMPVYVEWCSTHMLLCFCFVFPRLCCQFLWNVLFDCFSHIL